ncbi:MAG: sugar phosphate isomerase/epimerase family protein [Flavobacteriaceae bacterium]|nr:sugar phosphate isomerase/epimerase family protein [Flavobacteriaceae bacterium]
MKRRTFVKNSTQAGLAFGLMGLAACRNGTSQQTENPTEAVGASTHFKISLAQWSLNKAIRSGEMSPFDFSDKAKALGFEGIEFVNQLYFDEIDKHPNRLSGINHFVSETLKRSRDADMQHVLIMIDHEGEVATADAEARAKAIENHRRWIDAAQGLGCHAIRLNLFGSEDVEAWKTHAVESLSILSDYAATQKINVIVENHGGFSSNGALLAEVMRTVDKPNCGTLPDFGNFCMKRDSGAVFEGACVEEYDKYQGVADLMPFAKGVSAKAFDFDINGNETTIDFLKMFQIVKKANFKGWVGIEYEGENHTAEDGILLTKALLEKTFKQLT